MRVKVGVAVKVGLGQPPVTTLLTLFENSAGGESSESIMAVLVMGLQTPALTTVRKLTLPVLPQDNATFQVRNGPGPVGVLQLPHELAI